MKNEKRGFDRGYTMLYVTISDGKRFLKEFVLNASSGGLMIQSTEVWESGVILDLIIHANVPIITKGKVTWIRHEENTYTMVIEFEDISSAATAWWADLLENFYTKKNE
ncbi:MAG: PilZ domain-containing protein [Pseudomonadota bacterium]